MLGKKTIARILEHCGLMNRFGFTFAQQLAVYDKPYQSISEGMKQETNSGTVTVTYNDKDKTRI